MGASKTLTERFELACQQLIKDEGFNRVKYLNLKKDKIPLVSLVSPLSSIAAKYISHTKKYSAIKFPAEVIVKIASAMDVYVTDLTTLGRKTRKS